MNDDPVSVLIRAAIKHGLHSGPDLVGINKSVNFVRVVGIADLNGVDHHVQNFEARPDGLLRRRRFRFDNHRRGHGLRARGACGKEKSERRNEKESEFAIASHRARFSATSESANPAESFPASGLSALPAEFPDRPGCAATPEIAGRWE